MGAASAPTGTYLRRVLRWWAGEGPAAKPQLSRFRVWLDSRAIRNPNLQTHQTFAGPGCAPSPGMSKAAV
ncbi:hypothetical protein XarbCFBP7408_12720 [Xanthomonas arboricola pv. guizotiae]|uniref:Uncharacterized protein n=1 Tax=Xanthomonas arboricola pv. guizotiae TaxID=487867 RepID=A0A2S7A3X1_9XANT|nr:hypothetical protein XarbCFBP7409_08255 [Xanthomonas arboricola pv. guizotiae]PPU23051.1 hypothetical protein XarbCFBP7408_12720 [Xanthomonas arboricola pv. guizotiae]